MSTSRRGSALLTVLWLTAALSAIGLAVASQVRGETERASTGVDETKSYFAARGAIERAALHILWRGFTDTAGHSLYYQQGQNTMALDFPAAQAVVEIIPETSKLNLNTTRPEDILRLIAALGVPIDRATAITSAIVDWRTPVDPLHPSQFDAFYLAQSPSFLPTHASYRENEELLLTQGVTPGLYYGNSLDNSRPGLRDCLSIYGSQAYLDVNTAQYPTLVAAGLSNEDARALVQRRAEHPIQDFNEMQRLQLALGPSGQRLMLGGHAMFTLRATARLKLADGKLSDLRRTVAALVTFQPVNGNGFEVLRWFDR